LFSFSRHKQARQPTNDEVETPKTSGRRACLKTKQQQHRLLSKTFDGSHCSGTCESELGRTRVYSNGVRQRLQNSFYRTEKSKQFTPAWMQQMHSQHDHDPVLITSTATTDSAAFIQEMIHSKFCLCPLGHATWSKRSNICFMLLATYSIFFDFQHLFLLEQEKIVLVLLLLLLLLN
jgi:hypothetical protein